MWKIIVICVILTIVVLTMYKGFSDWQPKVMIFTTACSIVFSLTSGIISFFEILSTISALITIFVFLISLYMMLFAKK